MLSIRKISLLLLIIGLGLSYLSCSKKSDEGSTYVDPYAMDCTGIANKFTADINPIVQTYCNMNDCHNAGSTHGVGPLTNYTEVYKSRVKIRGAIGSGFMPLGLTLTRAQRSSIICWIDAGANNN